MVVFFTSLETVHHIIQDSTETLDKQYWLRFDVIRQQETSPHFVFTTCLWGLEA